MSLYLEKQFKMLLSFHGRKNIILKKKEKQHE